MEAERLPTPKYVLTQNIILLNHQIGGKLNQKPNQNRKQKNPSDFLSEELNSL